MRTRGRYHSRAANQFRTLLNVYHHNLLWSHINSIEVITAKRRAFDFAGARESKAWRYQISTTIEPHVRGRSWRLTDMQNNLGDLLSIILWHWRKACHQLVALKYQWHNVCLAIFFDKPKCVHGGSTGMSNTIPGLRGHSHSTRTHSSWSFGVFCELVPLVDLSLVISSKSASAVGHRYLAGLNFSMFLFEH